MKRSDAMRDDPCRPRHYRPQASAPVPPDGPAQAAIELSHTRRLIAGARLQQALVLIGARRGEVAGFKAGDVRVARGHVAAKTVITRADIVDRNGALLATTLAAPSLFADSKLIADKRDTARKLAFFFNDMS